jgi:predicted metal-dependent phosphoesterase TrpH
MPTTRACSRACYATRGGRGGRAQEMSDQLAKVGIQGAYEGALKYAGNPELISRTHFARFLVEQGRLPRHQRGIPQVPHRRQARLRAAPLGLAEGRGALDHRAQAAWPSSPTRPLQVHGQRGVRAVLRVQGPWRPGGRGRHRQPHRRRGDEYADTALEFGLAASRGSDFHSPDESHTDLGQLPFLPGELTPVWELLADRIQ